MRNIATMFGVLLTALLLANSSVAGPATAAAGEIGESIIRWGDESSVFLREGTEAGARTLARETTENAYRAERQLDELTELSNLADVGTLGSTIRLVNEPIEGIGRQEMRSTSLFVAPSELTTARPNLLVDNSANVVDAGVDARALMKAESEAAFLARQEENAVFAAKKAESEAAFLAREEENVAFLLKKADDESSAEAAANVALAGGKTRGAAAQLDVGGRTFTDVSGPKTNLQPELQNALNNVPQAQRAQWHGHCAEIGCINKAFQSGINPGGGRIRAVNIGQSGRGQGTPKPACSSCTHVLDQMEINH